MPPAGTPSCPPSLSLAERQQSDKPETGLQCLFTKHREGPLGSPSACQTLCHLRGEGLPAHSQAPHTSNAHLQKLATRGSIQPGPTARESVIRHKEELSVKDRHSAQRKQNLLKYCALLIRTLGSSVQASFHHSYHESTNIRIPSPTPSSSNIVIIGSLIRVTRDRRPRLYPSSTN